MPWPLYGRMSDTDLRAIYRCLASLAPVHNDVGQAVQRKGGGRVATGR